MQLGRQAWTEARTILTDGLTAALTGSGTTRDDVVAASHLLVSGCIVLIYLTRAANAVNFEETKHSEHIYVSGLSPQLSRGLLL